MGWALFRPTKVGLFLALSVTACELLVQSFGSQKSSVCRRLRQTKTCCVGLA